MQRTCKLIRNIFGQYQEMGLMQQTECIGKSLLCFNWTDILENLKHINPNAFNNKVIICKNIVHGVYNKMFLIDK